MKELGSGWAVLQVIKIMIMTMMMMMITMLQCGHCYCVECIRIIIDEYSTRRATKCAVCRSMTAHAEISYVSTQPEQPELELEEEVRGSHSTKVEAVLRSASCHKVLQSV